MKTILVTGGAGFIGNCFCKLLLKERPEWRVVNVDALTYAANPSTIKEELGNPNYTFYKTDIRDREAIFSIFEREKPRVVVNFAAESHVDRSIENPGIFLETNILGTQVLMDACRKYGVERFHQVGTDEVYGDLPLDRPDLFFHMRIPRSTRRAPIRRARRRRTCLRSPITVRTACPSPFRVAATTTDPISSRKN